MQIYTIWQKWKNTKKHKKNVYFCFMTGGGVYSCWDRLGDKLSNIVVQGKAIAPTSKYASGTHMGANFPAQDNFMEGKLIDCAGHCAYRKVILNTLRNVCGRTLRNARTP